MTAPVIVAHDLERSVEAVHTLESNTKLLAESMRRLVHKLNSPLNLVFVLAIFAGRACNFQLRDIHSAELAELRLIVRRFLHKRQSQQCEMSKPWYHIGLGRRWRNGKNFGDDLNVDLASAILGLSRENVVTTTNRFVKGKILAIGSVLTHVEEGDLIFGTGLSFFSRDAAHGARTWENLNKSTIYSLRGPDSFKRAALEGIKPPWKFGDLGITASLLIWPNLHYVSPSVDVCVVPHATDTKLRQEAEHFEGVIILDISPDLPVTLMRQLLKCRRVFSSSLHVLMVALAFDIPCVWMNGPDSNHPAKYLDFFHGMYDDANFTSYSTLEDAMEGKEFIPAINLQKMLDVTLTFISHFPFDKVCK